jgi:adenylate cyclase
MRTFMRSKLARLGQGRVAAIGLLLLLLGALVPEQSPLFRPVRNAIFDTYQALAPRQRLSAPVVIVAIDDASLSRHGQWPWPRTVLAQLITRIADHQPAVIGIDILMPEVDRLSPPRIPELVPNLPPDVVGQLMRAPSNESVLAAALRRTRTVIGVAGLDHDYGVARTRGSWAPIRVYGGDPVPFVRRFVVGLRSVDEIDRAATGRALLNADPEGGVVRRLPLVAAVGDMLAPGLAPELLRVAIGDASLAVHATSAGVQALAIGDVRAPTERDGTMRISYSPHDGSRFVSASDVLAGAVQDAVFSRKVVLIGLTAVGLNDDQATPIFERMPGVEIHAQAIENIFDGTSLSRPAWGSWVEGAATALAGLLVIAIVPRSTVIAAAILVGVVISFWLSGFLTYLNARVLVDSASPTLSVTAVFGLSLGISLRASRRERREIRRAFERYVHPSVVASLIAEPERLVLGGERRDLTVLFADLAGFTSVSERHAPETVATLLNRCLTVVTRPSCLTAEPSTSTSATA